MLWILKPRNCHSSTCYVKLSNCIFYDYWMFVVFYYIITYLLNLVEQLSFHAVSFMVKSLSQGLVSCEISKNSDSLKKTAFNCILNFIVVNCCLVLLNDWSTYVVGFRLRLSTRVFLNKRFTYLLTSIIHSFIDAWSLRIYVSTPLWSFSPELSWKQDGAKFVFCFWFIFVNFYLLNEIHCDAVTFTPKVCICLVYVCLCF
jgi:hypothetical protein